MVKKNDYWAKRINQIFDENEKRIQTDYLYRQSYQRFREEIKQMYHDLDGRQLSRTELYRFAKFLAFRNKLANELRVIGTVQQTRMEKGLLRAYKEAGLCAKETLGKSSEWTILNRKMAEACVQRKWAGSHFSKRIWKNRNVLAQTVEQGVTDCIINGKSPNELIHTITENWDAGRSRANTLVRTELAHTLNTAQVEIYDSEGVRYLDFDCEPSACQHCLDIAAGNPWKIDRIPCMIGHPNCRCTWLPVLDDDERLKEGKVDRTEDLRYNDEENKQEKQPYLQEQLDYTLANGEKAFIPAKAVMKSARTIAGKGSKTELRAESRLIDAFGGKQGEWKKRVGKIESAKYIFDVHWYELNRKQYKAKLKHRGDKE